MDDDILALLACPKCRGPLAVTTAGPEGMLCSSCRVVYPVIDEIPVLLMEEALPLPPDGPAA